MSSSPREIFSVAEALSALPYDEHTGRSVINRSYYAAYHGAKLFHARLPMPGSVGKANGSHEQLIASLDNPTIPKTEESGYWLSKGLAKSLRIVFDKRVLADYYLDQDLLDADVKLAMDLSREILNRTSELK